MTRQSSDVLIQQIKEHSKLLSVLLEVPIPLPEHMVQIRATISALQTELQKYSKGYVKYEKFSIEQILPIIGVLEIPFVVRNAHINHSSIRLHTFKKSGIVCHHCGLKGTHFWVEQAGNGGAHLNLYATMDNGDEVMMTSDHIIPKSKGGSNALTNRQTLCIHCNNKKADTMPEPLVVIQ